MGDRRDRYDDPWRYGLIRGLLIGVIVLILVLILLVATRGLVPHAR